MSNREFDELKEALTEDKSNIVHETADTIYHLLVALEVANINFEDVLEELENRLRKRGTDSEEKIKIRKCIEGKVNSRKPVCADKENEKNLEEKFSGND
mgnify:CR=1 FL=1